MCVLNDRTIRRLAINDDLITPFNSARVQPASYDLALSPTLIFGHVDYSNGKRNFALDEYIPVPNEGILLWPGQHMLGVTVEKVRLPANIAGQLALKSTRGREGLDHALAGWIDPGFDGHITLELHAHRPVLLTPYLLTVQIIFHRLVEPAQQPYQGRYVDSGDAPVGPRPPKGSE